MTGISFADSPEAREWEEDREADEERTGRLRCIGCGRFLRSDANWNQCADCDTRVEGLPAFFA